MSQSYHPLLLILMSSLVWITTASAEPTASPTSSTPTVITLSSVDDYDMVKSSIEMAILDRGFVISGTLHIGQMLSRTATDLQLAAPPYQQAASLEFCSAVYSHKMTQLSPLNIAVCPFAIALYVLNTEPDTVYVAYQPVTLDKGTAPATAAEALAGEINAMLAEVVHHALE